MSEQATHHEAEKPNKGVSDLSNEQIGSILKRAEEIRSSDSKTPTLDMRSMLGEEIGFKAAHEMNNLEVRDFIDAAEEQKTDRDKESLQAIVDAAEQSETMADLRTKLSQQEGFRKIYDIKNNLELKAFIEDAKKRLAEYEETESGISDKKNGTGSNMDGGGSKAELSSGSSDSEESDTSGVASNVDSTETSENGAGSGTGVEDYAEKDVSPRGWKERIKDAYLRATLALSDITRAHQNESERYQDFEKRRRSRNVALGILGVAVTGMSMRVGGIDLWPFDNDRAGNTSPGALPDIGEGQNDWNTEVNLDENANTDNGRDREPLEQALTPEQVAAFDIPKRSGGEALMQRLGVSTGEWYSIEDTLLKKFPDEFYRRSDGHVGLADFGTLSDGAKEYIARKVGIWH